MVPGPGRMETDGENPAVAGRRKVGVYLCGGSERGFGVGNDGDVHPEEAEYGHTVHCYTIASGLLRGEGEE